VCSLDQVVAKQSFGRKTLSQNRMKCPDVIDRLAVKNRFSEEILLSVADGLAVWIGALGIGKYPGESGGVGVGQSDVDARLYDREAARTDACRRVDHHAV